MIRADSHSTSGGSRMEKRKDRIREEAAKNAIEDLDVIERVKETQRRKMLKKELAKTRKMLKK